MNNNESFFDIIEDTLILDIGSGTQDVLYARAHTNPENWIRFILPSPAKLVAQKIALCTATKTPICLTGSIMGGGFYKALQAHLSVKPSGGLPKRVSGGVSVLATQNAALSLFDDIERVKALGIKILSETETKEIASLQKEENESHKIVHNEFHKEYHKEYLGHRIIELTDFSPSFWKQYLECIGLAIPHNILIAAQDHGVHANTSNRIGRFNLWKELLQKSQDPCDWIFHTIPAPYTRLKSIQASSNASYLADTGTAALLGALSMPEIRARSNREGVTIVNVGNSHVLAFLVYQSKVCGIYEHHSSMHSTESLQKDLQEFRLAWLPDEEVRAKGGHGCVFHQIPAEAEGFRPTYILGPRRNLLEGCGQFIAPHGDMMMAGAYGLLYAFTKK